jgi:hypothetical protein
MKEAFSVRRTAFSVAAAALMAATAAAQFSVPDAKVIPGWQGVGKAELFAKADLYGFMDGGAELFFEYGFQDLTVQKYARDKDELTLEAYRMADAEGALGIYLIRAGRETQVKGVEGRSTGDRYQFSAVKGNFLFQVNNFKGDVKRVPDMVILMNAALATLIKDWPAPVDPLPKENRVPGSFLILRGPLAMARLITLGEGDILHLKGKVTAYAADYEDPKKGTYGMIMVPYPDAAAAGNAFEYLAGHLDHYLTVVQKVPSRLVYRDYQGKYGEAVLAGTALRLKIGMANEPK